MYILFKNIPIGTHDYELTQFIKRNTKQVLKKTGLSLSVSGVKILERQDNFCHPLEQFGLTILSPDKVAKKIIIHLNGCSFNNLKLTVREYTKRSPANDPRNKSCQSTNPHIEQRIKDRRNHNLISSRLV